jgi:hypothetical protein
LLSCMLRAILEIELAVGVSAAEKVHDVAGGSCADEARCAYAYKHISREHNDMMLPGRVSNNSAQHDPVFIVHEDSSKCNRTGKCVYARGHRSCRWTCSNVLPYDFTGLSTLSSRHRSLISSP